MKKKLRSEVHGIDKRKTSEEAIQWGTIFLDWLKRVLTKDEVKN